MKELRQSLHNVSQQKAISIPLAEKRFNLHLAVITDPSLLDHAKFFLGVSASVPAIDVRRRFPVQVKIGPPEQIAQLVTRNLPGIGVWPLTVAPRQIPFHADQVYFALDQASEWWKELTNSGCIAMHIGGEFPGIEMEFWAITGLASDDPIFDSIKDWLNSGSTPGKRQLQGGELSSLSLNEPHTAFPQSHELSSFRRNSLLNSAAVLFTLVGQLRSAASYTEVDSLRTYLIRQLKDFENNARSLRSDPESVFVARYALCTLLDETVLNASWGSESSWSEQSLLRKFHKELWGGERFFQLIELMIREPARNIDLLELMFVCLSFGFKGKYGEVEGGQVQLERIKNELLQTIRSIRGEIERDLSPHWRGVQNKRNSFLSYIPFWVVVLILAIIVLGTIIGFRISSTGETGRELEGLKQLGRQESVEPRKHVSPQPQPTLTVVAQLLQKDMKIGHIDLVEKVDHTKIIIPGDGLFTAGSARVTLQYHLLISRIAEPLVSVPGRILVTGHTDNVPFRSSSSFKSTWNLSRERAASVVKLLAAHLGSSKRLVAECRADTEPLAPNDTPGNRTRNRRIEISLVKIVEKSGSLKIIKERVWS